MYNEIKKLSKLSPPKSIVEKNEQEEAHYNVDHVHWGDLIAKLSKFSSVNSTAII